MSQKTTTPVAEKPVVHTAAARTAMASGVTILIAMLPDIARLFNEHAHLFPPVWRDRLLAAAGVLLVISNLFGAVDTKRAAQEGPTS